MEEKMLLQGICNSQIDCYEMLIDKYSPYIARVVMKVASNRLDKEDMEEICADVFIKIWENRTKINIKEGALKSYLAAIARNKTINRLRGLGIKEILPLEEDCIKYDTPEALLMEQESTEFINSVISILPEPDREIFIRRYFYMEKLSEIAEEIGISAATVGTKLFRGKRKLEKVLKERGVSYE